MLLALALLLPPLALAAYWSVALAQILRTFRDVPTARDGARLARTSPPTARVAIIVPAHNERAVIARLIASIRAQTHADLHAILVLDRCTDDTAAVARDAIAGDPRFTILENGSCPDGWAGKVHAAHLGRAEAARIITRDGRPFDFLLFTDADNEFDPELLAATLALARERRLALLSLLSTPARTHWFEKIAQPWAGLELMRQYPLRRANLPDNPRAFANGQYMLFRADRYDTLGGHEAVREALLEDLALARRFAEHKEPVGAFLSAGMLRVAMYDAWPAFQSGWKRIYIESARRKPARLRRAALHTLAAGVLLPVAGLACAILLTLLPPTEAAAALRTSARVLAWLAFVPWLACATIVVRQSRLPAPWALAHPIGAWLVARILARAARDLRRRVPIRWAGKDYVLEPRD
ncbi:MAG: glycosyltransferase [Phycisphaerales bacterium]|jgi:chlorobactene glucosyltransferase|nr:glycosyltransferase [Phycisphaerales bacterium]